ncbi:MAG: FxsA family protein [Bacillota bacterium]
MFVKLLVLFMVVPIVELALLIKLGTYIGVISTVLLVGITGIVGVSLARQQGFQVISRVKTAVRRGEVPTDDLIGGLLILSGGIMLLTPGLLTDITGFSFIIPGSRKLYIKLFKNLFKDYVKKNFDYQNFNFYNNSTDNEQENNNDYKDFIDIEKEDDPDKNN